MFELVEERLEGAGLGRYEISSYAAPGRRSRHNRRYWERRPVLGLGMGAWSSEPPGPGAPFGARRSNPRTLVSYLATAREGGHEEGAREVLGEAVARGEAVFLALRTVEGLDAVRFEREFGASPRRCFASEIDTLVAGGQLEEGADGGLRLTRAGRRVSDAVFERFVAPARPRSVDGSG